MAIKTQGGKSKLIRDEMGKTFQTLNELEAASLVTRYAIGGAFALSFYTEPIVTFALRIPTGFRPKAQGCEARATLGQHPQKIPNRNAVAAIPFCPFA